jgi:hypothetical protein
MSFEFDPNKNPDRSEDGNDPQDIESLGGEGGLYGRVPGGPQVGAANRSQGQAHDGPGRLVFILAGALFYGTVSFRKLTSV